MKQLKGTEKQIAWAESIREESINTCDKNIELAKERIEKYPGVASYERDLKAYEEIKSQVVSVFDKIEDAAYIIDNRKSLDSNRIVYLANQLILKMEREERA